MVTSLKAKLSSDPQLAVSASAAATIKEADALAQTATAVHKAVSSTASSGSNDPFAAAIAAGAAAMALHGKTVPATAVTATATSAKCEFQNDVDYQDPGETMKEGLTKEQCCNFCGKLNEANAGSCILAVYSAGE